jgi:prolyl-tRNA synthetase
MGALVMAHGDDAGLRVPPRLAPVQVVVLVVRDEDGASDKAAAIAAELTGAGVRTRLDTRTDTSFGRRVVDWELKGVPVRVEVGPRELEAGEAVLVRRDVATKTTVPLAGLAAAVGGALDEAQSAMLAEAMERRLRGTVEVSSVDEAEEAARTGFAIVPLSALGSEGETRLNAAGASVRLVMRPDGTLPEAGEDGPGADLVAVVARAY